MTVNERNTAAAKKRFHSCFVVDVTGEPQYGRIRLTDSTRASWFVDTGNESDMAGFETWFAESFLKGVPNTLTVFEYEDRGSDPDIENYVKGFFGTPSGKQQLNG